MLALAVRQAGSRERNVWSRSAAIAIGSATRDNLRAGIARRYPAQGVIVVLLRLVNEVNEAVLPSCCRIAFFCYIHNKLIINMYQTGMCVVPVGKKTLAFKGSQHVVLLGVDDKRQITMCAATTVAGRTLPPRVIFQGKTARCLPKGPAMDALCQHGCHLTFSENHWANMETMQAWFDEALTMVPDIAKQRSLLAKEALAKLLAPPPPLPPPLPPPPSPCHLTAGLLVGAPYCCLSRTCHV